MAKKSEVAVLFKEMHEQGLLRNLQASANTMVFQLPSEGLNKSKIRMYTLPAFYKS